MRESAAGSGVATGEALALVTPGMARWLCDRHFGVGGDGVIVGPLPGPDSGSAADPGEPFRLLFFNPDGSNFEKSGNGLRIFARYLWDCGLVGQQPFTIETPGGAVRCTVAAGGETVRVEMGQVNFDSTQIPVLGPQREVLDETLQVGGEQLRYCAATIGNPHCVVLRAAISKDEALRLGPMLEREPRFPNRTNVQFLQVVDPQTIRIEIWERGAGYTLSSGTSSCAAAAVAHRLGLCGSQVTVEMPGGRLQVEIGEDFSVVLQGPVEKVCEGVAYEPKL
jgi:diaminopimelate epimerase